MPFSIRKGYIKKNEVINSEWVKSLNRAWLFATPWTTAHQAPSSMGFSRQEYWSGVPFTVKNAESQRIDAFELWCWRRLLRVPWTARKSNQSILKEISPKYSFFGRTDAEAPILWPPNVKNWFIWKDPDGGKDWRQEKGMTEDKLVEWCHWFNKHEFE